MASFPVRVPLGLVARYFRASSPLEARRYITCHSLRNQGSLKSVDDEAFNLLTSHYKNGNCLNLSVSNNIIPKYLREYFSLDLNKNLSFDVNHLKMIEDMALSLFHLEPKYWGCTFGVNSTVDYPPGEVDHAFIFTLFRSLTNCKGRVMNISFPLSQEGEANSPLIENYHDSVNVKIKDKINYEEIHKIYDAFNPDLVYVDETNNPYNFNYDFFSNLKDINKCVVITNMSNKGSLISQNLIPSPFNHSDVVYTYFNENMRAHNCHVIFYKRGYKQVDTKGKLIHYEYEKKLKNYFLPIRVNNTILSFLTSFRMMKNAEFKEYVIQSKENTRALLSHLNKDFFNIQYAQNSNFLNLNCTISPFNVYEFHQFCKELNIFFDILNPFKYTQKSFNVGTNYLTSMGLLESDMKTVAEFLNRTLSLYLSAKRLTNCANDQFVQFLKHSYVTSPNMLSLSNDIFCFISSFPDVHS
ncbi:serine hydroxymethyltransferase, putative [Plasmodium knowlesi strain H]|uniref:Serine hydroxymethyltransferase, putative n=3 Tax=Plasmodium knowlesi TaxID=5850 RepID=A0A5K1VHQ4_PLAKH|nr:serine hydroxymethyltransferase, putative [Plasmodium knowlesi strain H]OTN65434.1 putative Serine hydroxymethyltransferase [Plasmodium knowlesi]CAA9989585.1 serine hydroxymethyltransferase, putative [Plasmodium knowlesi strain H]SBO22640.1 serine hydroxymethyltransferase, putative [Plasmodium knowlesi strain H]SBO23405.1 serine hydroxymethyltransferase, putative [Plasmodium knowlesi strain H]VVS79059.1 serine hydroxymethyltransferase, putative [Plasmodium knowlesi strain H]|eukprot:XP_002260310.1 serine hydroxymethyltransferase putative [Plasmodium knowlesi strain H]